MTPAQTDALIELVTRYQKAFRSDVEADGIDTPRYRRLTTAHAALVDWKEAPTIIASTISREVASFPEGQAWLQWSTQMSAESVGELEEWLLLVVKKLKRRCPAPKATP